MDEAKAFKDKWELVGTDEIYNLRTTALTSAQRDQAEKMKEKLAIQKERRLAAEERKLMKGGKGGKKGDAS